jgi:hypothetical protein
MDTEQIEQVFKKLGVPGKVYAVDMLPSRIQYPSVMISNTDPHDEPGAHWIAICFDAHGRGEYFDPYGLQPFPPFIPFLEKNTSTWIYNDVCLQSPLSQTCGQHCLAYSIHRWQGINMNSYVKHFSKNLLKNDLIVYNFIKHI